jgi:hypothetical protein
VLANRLPIPLALKCVITTIIIIIIIIDVVTSEERNVIKKAEKILQYTDLITEIQYT